MCDSAEAGDGGGAGVAGQDSEADGEPPHLAPSGFCESDSVEIGVTSEEGVPPTAKRFRMSKEELGRDVEPEKVYEGTPAEEKPTSPAQSTIFRFRYF